MRKIGAYYPLWDGELFIKPHLDMIENYVDRILIGLQKGPLPSYKKDHGYSDKKNLTREILKKYHPFVQTFESNYDISNDFKAGIYNEGLNRMIDYDIVLRLDPDMFWRDEDFSAIIKLIKETEFDCYRMDFPKNSINYYVTGDFDHGLRDAKELDPLAVNPKKLFTGIVDYDDSSSVNINLDNCVCHHFRGWGKPKSVTKDFPKTLSEEYIKKYGGWVSCPDDIKNKIQNWLNKLKIMKEGEK